MKQARFVGEYPKVGIRPVIDARQGGVRESLEEQTMNMARSVAALLSGELKYTDGTSVQCVIADSTIGRVPEAAACAEKFREEGVGLVISVTPCWCYGSETIDYDGRMPQAIWGFNGTERPGAVYLAAALAGHSQKGMPAFGIYGQNVQDVDDRSIPEDVKEKLLRFARAGIAVAMMKGKSYLSIGSVAMGIAGSIVNADFFQTYLGMRNEYVDMSEIIRRIDEGIYDKEEYVRAIAWTEKYCKKNEGTDFNIEEKKKNRIELDADWEYVVKMFLVFRDLMCGNVKLREMGFKEEALGYNAIVGGFQGQRQWTDHMPNGDFAEALMNCNSAISADAQYPYSYHNRGIAYAGLNNPSAAINEFNRAIAMRPNFFNTLLNRAKAYLSLGNTAAAIRDYEDVLRLKPDNEEARQLALRGSRMQLTGGGPAMQQSDRNEDELL